MQAAEARRGKDMPGYTLLRYQGAERANALTALVREWFIQAPDDAGAVDLAQRLLVDFQVSSERAVLLNENGKMVWESAPQRPGL